jgi:hypothetical protein
MYAQAALKAIGEVELIRSINRKHSRIAMLASSSF